MRRTFKGAFLIVVLVIALMLAPIGGSSQAQTRPTFSLASLPSAVLEAMGEPGRKSVSSLDDQTWYYGASWVRFVQGLVREYLNTGNLPVNLGSKSAKPFLVWLVCHRVTVIAALGTPASVTRTTPTGAIWGYGKSSITIRNNKVAGWTDKGELRSHFKPVTTKMSSNTSTKSSTTSSGTPSLGWFVQRSSQQAEDVTVYITRTGSKYHRYGCQYLRLSCIPIARSSAISSG